LLGASDTATDSVAEFSDEQRSRIFDGVMRIAGAPVAEVAAPEVADSLPADAKCELAKL
jgi:hypothetical protein